MKIITHLWNTKNCGNNVFEKFPERTYIVSVYRPRNDESKQHEVWNCIENQQEDNKTSYAINELALQATNQ